MLTDNPLSQVHLQTGQCVSSSLLANSESSNQRRVTKLVLLSGQCDEYCEEKPCLTDDI